MHRPDPQCQLALVPRVVQWAPQPRDQHRAAGVGDGVDASVRPAVALLGPPTDQSRRLQRLQLPINLGVIRAPAVPERAGEALLQLVAAHRRGLEPLQDGIAQKARGGHGADSMPARRGTR